MIKINVDTRIWEIPEEEKILGVESDDKVKTLQFELSKNEFYNGLNFTDCNCFINYKNEYNDTIPYGITDMELQEDGTVTFTWEVSRGATISKGNTVAILCVKKVREDGTITNEWNSRVGTFRVHKGIEPSDSIVEKPEIDIVSQLLVVAQQANTNAQTNIDQSEKLIEQSNSLLEKAEGLGYLEEEFDVLEARMDQFTSLEEGSTTGDAELQDIRVGYDGAIYDSAGGAVREQASQLSNNIKDIADIKRNLVISFEKGKYWSNENVLTSHTGYTAIAVDVRPGMIVSFNTSMVWVDNFCLMIGNNNEIIGKFDSSLKQTDGDILFSEMPDNVFKLHLTVASESVDVIAIEGKENIKDYTFSQIPLNSLYRVDLNDKCEVKNVGNLKDKLLKYERYGIENLKNLVIDKKVGYCWFAPNSLGQVSGYTAIKVDVTGGGVFTFNANNYANDAFCFIVDEDNSIIDKFTSKYIKEDNDGTIYAELPSNSAYLLLTKYGEGWDTVVFKGKINIKGWSDIDYPLNTISNEVLFSNKSFFEDISIKKLNGLNFKYQKVFYCGANEQFTTLKSAIEEATKYMGSKLIVRKGIYDLVEEFGGKQALDSLAEEKLYGLFLKNNIHIIFESGAECTFMYEGDNPIVHEYFSIFNASEYGFTLENVKATSKNCRYTVHDERGFSDDSYTNKYLNCILSHDSSQCSWGAHQCIGGGTGRKGTVIIDSCECYSSGCNDTIFYHNDARTNINDCQTNVIIKNCYLSGGVRCANYGASALKSKVTVTNCNLGYQNTLEKVITEDRLDNMELVEWNNIVRE